MKRKMAAALGVLILGISILACGDSAQTGGQNEAVTQTGGSSTEQEIGAQAEERDTVIVAMGTTSEPAAGFDPCVNWGCGEHCHEPLIQSTLLRTTADLEFENDLATDYQVSEDGLTWTFTIREDVKFSDGSFCLRLTWHLRLIQCSLRQTRRQTLVCWSAWKRRMTRPLCFI